MDCTIYCIVIVSLKHANIGDTLLLENSFNSRIVKDGTVLVTRQYIRRFLDVSNIMFCHFR